MRTRKGKSKERSEAQKAGGNNDTLNSDLILLQAADAVISRIKVNRRFDIPYLAGYSRDGRTVYLDRHLPKFLRVGGRRDLQICTYVILHETIEKALVDQLKLVYQDAHQIAQRVEQAVIRAAKVSWRNYNAFIQKQVDRVLANPSPRLPPDLDLEPYRDEQDWDELRRMQGAKPTMREKTRESMRI